MTLSKLLKKYTPEELAESFVFRNTLSGKQKIAARKQLAEARQKLKKKNH